MLFEPSYRMTWKFSSVCGYVAGVPRRYSVTCDQSTVNVRLGATPSTWEVPSPPYVPPPCVQLYAAEMVHVDPVQQRPVGAAVRVSGMVPLLVRSCASLTVNGRLTAPGLSGWTVVALKLKMLSPGVTSPFD